MSDPLDPQLSPEQEAEAQRIATIVHDKVKTDVLHLARLLASKADPEFFGKTEFEVRDRVHEIGACALEAALVERKKRATSVRASSAQVVGNRPVS